MEDIPRRRTLPELDREVSVIEPIEMKDVSHALAAQLLQIRLPSVRRKFGVRRACGTMNDLLLL